MSESVRCKPLVSVAMSFLCCLSEIDQTFYLAFADMKFSVDKLKSIDWKRTVARKTRKAVAKNHSIDPSEVV